MPLITTPPIGTVFSLASPRAEAGGGGGAAERRRHGGVAAGGGGARGSGAAAGAGGPAGGRRAAGRVGGAAGVRAARCGVSGRWLYKADDHALNGVVSSSSPKACSVQTGGKAWERDEDAAAFVRISWQSGSERLSNAMCRLAEHGPVSWRCAPSHRLWRLPVFASPKAPRPCADEQVLGTMTLGGRAACDRNVALLEMVPVFDLHPPCSGGVCHTGSLPEAEMADLPHH